MKQEPAELTEALVSRRRRNPRPSGGEDVKPVWSVLLEDVKTVNGRKASLPAEDAATPVWSVLLEEVNEGNAKIAKSVKVPDMKRPF